MSEVSSEDPPDGEHWRSLLLFGLSPTNAHMRARDIIIHSAAYASESSSRQGNSWGCFALDPRIKDVVVTHLVNGALLLRGSRRAQRRAASERRGLARARARATARSGCGGVAGMRRRRCVQSGQRGRGQSSVCR